MAKRPAEDDEDDLLKVRKRRYKPQKNTDDEDDASSPGARRGMDEDEEDEEDSISTGNVYLDITLDFRDDCIDWAKAHLLYAIIIGAVSFLLVAVLSLLFVHSWVRYLSRPSLEDVTEAYKLGLFPETKLLADYALEYISPSEPEIRAPYLFLQGIALCAIADRSLPAEQRDYFLMAANYLKESAKYGFYPNRTAEGWFSLGKSLFRCGELEQCRMPLEIALDEKYPLTKETYWYLAYANFWGTSPDFNRSRQYLERFQKEPTALEEEIAESHLLGAMLALQTDGIESAENTFHLVPQFEQFEIMRNFVEGQIEFFKGRDFRQKAIRLETDPNPRALMHQLIAPVPVEPQDDAPPESEIETKPSVLEAPAAPAPVHPMNEAAVREFMLPENQPTPLIGLFDADSEVQQRIAAMQARYAQDAGTSEIQSPDLKKRIEISEDGIIVFPNETGDSTSNQTAPQPPIEETPFDPMAGDPVLRGIKQLRDSAADHYQRAIALFSEVTRNADTNAPWGRTARLLIGICYAEMEDANNANEAFRSLIETFPLSPESAAAGFFLGEYDQNRGNADAALRSFGYAFENIRKNPQYSSFWLPKTLITEKCSAMVRNSIERQKHAEAVKLLETLGGVMPTAVLIRLKAETYESWGTLLQSQSETTFGEKGDKLAEEAALKRQSAGTAFDELAMLLSDTQEYTNLLWRSADNYRIGKDFRRGIVEYKKFIKADALRHRPEVFLYLGEMYFNLDFLNEAADVLEEGLRDHRSHLLVPQIRLVLSYVHYEQKNWDKAKSLLQLNLIGEAAPVSATYRDSMYALGNICFEQGDWDSAVPYWEDALKIHPDAVQAADASYRLAQTYLRQAENRLNEITNNSPAAIRQSADSIAQSNRRRALTYFEQTERILTDRHRALGLTESEKLMLRNTQFSICSVLMTLKQYERVIPKLNTLATAYMNQPETLDALIRMAYAYRMSGNAEESESTLRRAEVILGQLQQTGVITDETDWRNMIERQRIR